MMKLKKIIMKNLKLLLLIIIAVMFFASSDSFAYPRHRYHRYYRVRPVYHTAVVKTYYVVKKPKIYHRHHRKVIRRVVLY
jgi:hypothetical protein